tara:strand:- start:164 stop:385 length:222 start_codon:yes stop_codon:yes gene_type:complete
MTISRIEIDGVQHQILHFRFAINNPNAVIFKEDETYFAEISGMNYILGFMDSDGGAEKVSKIIQKHIKTKETE